MAESLPTKKDIELLFKKLRSTQTNKVCFDCTAKNPTWASVTYGVFICIDCSAVHRSLGVHLSFVRSTQLDTNWTWIQLRQMQIGGNANAESFFRQHNCTTKDSQQKYTSSAAKMYKDRLHNAAVLAVNIYGEKIVLDQEPKLTPTSKEKDFDFFDEHANKPIELRENTYNITSTDPTGTSDNSSIKMESLSSQLCGETESKHIIGVRKVQSRRSGLGNRKSGGLGAQKISTDFAEIEKEAELASKLKMQESGSGNTQDTEITPEEENEQITSLRLVYEDLSLKQKKEEEKMKAVDPQKAKQMERLGMGFAARSGISHSALSDMKTIQQENLAKPKSPERPEDNFLEMDFSFSSNSNSDFLLKSWSDLRNSRNMSESRSSSSLLGERKEMKSTKFSDEHTERKYAPLPSGTTDEAQKKFGSAKSISSDQFFSDNSDNAWERSANLSRFEGSSSISSADYFNRNENIGRNSGAGNLISNSLISAPDLEDVRESVRQGVTKVAGRLSSLANGVMSSIQEKYGGY